MSTLKVDALKSANGNSFILDVAQRNVIINGDMSIAQRGTSNSGIVSGTVTHTMDKWYTEYFGTSGATGTWTQSQSTDAPDSTASTATRFNYSLKMECTTASTPLTSSQFLAVYQNIEGSSLDRLWYGTSNPKSATLSFWVKSNKTGTYNVVFHNVSLTRKYIGRYTIDAADTWEKKSITIPGDTYSGFVTNSIPGNVLSNPLRIHFVLATGTARQLTSLEEGVWQGSNSFEWGTGHTVNLADSTDNEWYLTGVQFEVGENTTEFQYETFQDNFMKCCRYYQRISRDDTPATSPTYTHGVYLGWGQFFSSTQAVIQWPLIVPFKASPTVTYSDATHISIVENGALTEPSTAIALYDDASHTSEYDARAPYLLFTTAAAVNARIGRAFINNATSGWIALGTD
jgi:hypothetical protein